MSCCQHEQLPRKELERKSNLDLEILVILLAVSLGLIGPTAEFVSHLFQGEPLFIRPPRIS